MLTRVHCRGFSLVELMAALASGLFILAGVGLVYAEVVRANAAVLKTAHLQQTLWSLMTTMADDLRRAGYWSRAELVLDGTAVNGFAPLHVAGDGGCILYSYDEDKDDVDGAPDPADQHGFRLVDGRLQIKTSDAVCGASTCSDCASGTWWLLTDPQAIRIRVLAFTAAERAEPLPGGAQQLVAREIAIALEGELAADAAVRHRLTTRVSVRNHAVR